MTIEQIILLPRTQLRESPTNPRKAYNEASLAELAETMKPPHGRIHSPLVVRLVEQEDIEYTYEIVFGHRRNRAAGLAGLDVVPVIVRSMSDADVRVAQLIENAQREDVSPLEEADSIHELRRVHSVSIEELMKRTGKSRRYVFASLKLATAHSTVRGAVEQGLIGAEIAKLLAALPNVLQPKALEDATYPVYGPAPGEPSRKAHSYRSVKDLLDRKYRLKLVEAPFDPEATNLLSTGVPCSRCPKLSDNEPAIMEDCGAGVCTDPECWSTKSKMHVVRVIDGAQEIGYPVIRAEDAKELLGYARDMEPDGYRVLGSDTGLKSAPDGLLQGRPLTFADLRDSVERDRPPITYIEHPHAEGVVLECITDEEAEQLLKMHGTSFAALEEANAPAWQIQRREEDERRAAEYEALSPELKAVDYRGEQWDAIKEAILRRVGSTPRFAGELRYALLSELEYNGDFGSGVERILGWTPPVDAEDERRWRAERVGTMSPDELAQLFVMVQIDREDFIRAAADPRSERLALARAYGVDVLNPTGELSAPPSDAARGEEVAAASRDADATSDTPSDAALAREESPPPAAKGANNKRTKKAAKLASKVASGDDASQAGSAGEVNGEADGSAAGGSTAPVSAEGNEVCV